MIGAIAGGAATGAASQAVGGAINMGVDAHVRNQNWSRQKRAMQEKYQWAVRDLRAAGLNPVLAARGGIGMGGAPALASSNSGGMSNLGGTAAAATAAGVQKARVTSEINKNVALEDAATAQAHKAHVEALNQREMTPFFRAQAEKMGWDAQSAQANMLAQQAALPELQAIADAWNDPKSRDQLISRYVFKPANWYERAGVTAGAGAYSLGRALDAQLDKLPKPKWSRDPNYKQPKQGRYNRTPRRR